MSAFTNKVAVITGGNNGIGLVTAKEVTHGVRNRTIVVLVVWFLFALGGSLLGVFDSGPRPSLLLGLALALATSALASNKGYIQVQEPVTVSGQQLPAGEYQIRWEGSGPNVELSILKGKKVVATSPARLVDLSQSSSYDSAVVRKNDDGSRSLSEIRFSGKKYALALGSEAAKADTAENTTK